MRAGSVGVTSSKRMSSLGAGGPGDGNECPRSPAWKRRNLAVMQAGASTLLGQTDWRTCQKSAIGSGMTPRLLKQPCRRLHWCRGKYDQKFRQGWGSRPLGLGCGLSSELASAAFFVAQYLQKKVVVVFAGLPAYRGLQSCGPAFFLRDGCLPRPRIPDSIQSKVVPHGAGCSYSEWPG